jgi:hypothetical protein
MVGSKFVYLRFYEVGEDLRFGMPTFVIGWVQGVVKVEISDNRTCVMMAEIQRGRL